MTQHLRTALVVAVAVVVLAVSATMVMGGARTNFVAHLDGQGVTPAVSTAAQGQATFQLSADGATLSYRVAVANLQDPTMAGIHLGSGGMGAMVACLYMPQQPPQGRVDGVLAQGTLTAADLTGPLAGHSLADLVDQINAGNAAVHVCTAQHMPEIAGQIQ